MNSILQIIILLLVNIIIIQSLSQSKSSLSSSTPRINCSISSFEVCLSKIKEVTENNHLAFASTERDLKEACRKLKDGVTCTDNHMNYCTGSNKKALIIFEEVVNGTRQVLKSLCVKGKFQQNYLRFAPCYKNISVSTDKCALWLKRVRNMSNTMQNNENVNEELKKFCCAFKESVNCQINFVRKDCGENGVKFFEKYLSEISNSLIHQHCASYTFGKNSCSLEDPKPIQSLSSSSAMLFPVIFIEIIAVTIILCFGQLFHHQF